MPDDSKLLFEVVCKGCRRTLVTVERLRDPVLAGQLRAAPHPNRSGRPRCWAR